MKRLTDLNVGESSVVKGLDKDSYVRRRLLDMGITPKVKIEISGKAPLGDPIEVLIRGYKLTLRKEEAKAIIID